ncbi:hypothetical protein AVEN_260427-1 [Araneus ventricosus]|uniref:Uncharacterized protein n=1 Tax=Araneus ventricosus TaxID=182803 RepID=A0A4Y2KEW7_ARAVE|nr:hypothetical protein AVEN_260427-1 [Araneus ventricosus]
MCHTYHVAYSKLYLQISHNHGAAEVWWYRFRIGGSRVRDPIPPKIYRVCGPSTRCICNRGSNVLMLVWRETLEGRFHPQTPFSSSDSFKIIRPVPKWLPGSFKTEP